MDGVPSKNPNKYAKDVAFQSGLVFILLSAASRRAMSATRRANSCHRVSIPASIGKPSSKQKPTALKPWPWPRRNVFAWLSHTCQHDTQ